MTSDVLTFDNLLLSSLNPSSARHASAPTSRFVQLIAQTHLIRLRSAIGMSPGHTPILCLAIRL